LRKALQVTTEVAKQQICMNLNCLGSKGSRIKGAHF